MLLGATDRQIRLIERFADCFTDHRVADLVVHEVPSLVGQRVFGIAWATRTLIDHDQLRHDPVLAVLGGKLEPRRADCAPLAGKSTLNRLELSRPEPTRYHKISYDAAAIEGLFVDLFLDAHAAPPPQITLDLDASAGSIEEVARIPGSSRRTVQIRRRWPKSLPSRKAGVRILLRADSGFARDALMAWCENNDVDFLFGLAKNARLNAEIATELAVAQEQSQRTGQPWAFSPPA